MKTLIVLSLILSTPSFAAVSSGGLLVKRPLLERTQDGGFVAPAFQHLDCRIYVNGVDRFASDELVSGAAPVKFTASIPSIDVLKQKLAEAAEGKLVAVSGGHPDLPTVEVSMNPADHAGPAMVLEMIAFLSSQRNDSAATAELLELVNLNCR